MSLSFILSENRIKMNKMFRFHIFAFFFAFILGIIYVYLDSPKPKLVIKYPTPYNAKKITYKGLSDECYQLEATQVECTDDAIEQPIV
jgi:hypothetical protein